MLPSELNNTITQTKIPDPTPQQHFHEGIGTPKVRIRDLAGGFEAFSNDPATIQGKIIYGTTNARFRGCTGSQWKDIAWLNDIDYQGDFKIGETVTANKTLLLGNGTLGSTNGVLCIGVGSCYFSATDTKTRGNYPRVQRTIGNRSDYTNRIGQRIVLSNFYDYPVKQLKVGEIRKVGAPTADVIVGIGTWNESDSILLATDSIPAATFADTAGYVCWANLNDYITSKDSGQAVPKFLVQLSMRGDTVSDTNYYKIAATSGGVYASGSHFKYSGLAWSNVGGCWETLNSRLALQPGKAYLTYPSQTHRTGFFGLSKEAGTDDDLISVQYSGRVSGLSGLSPGTRYYLASTAGGISIATASGIRTGIADSSTSLLINHT